MLINHVVVFISETRALRQDMTATDPADSFVAKMSIDPRDNLDRTVYFKDVEMQSVARMFAQVNRILSILNTFNIHMFFILF